MRWQLQMQARLVRWRQREWNYWPTRWRWHRCLCTQAKYQIFLFIPFTLLCASDSGRVEHAMHVFVGCVRPNNRHRQCAPGGSTVPHHLYVGHAEPPKINGNGIGVAPRKVHQHGLEFCLSLSRCSGCPVEPLGVGLVPDHHPTGGRIRPHCIPWILEHNRLHRGGNLTCCWLVAVAFLGRRRPHPLRIN